MRPGGDRTGWLSWALQPPRLGSEGGRDHHERLVGLRGRSSLDRVKDGGGERHVTARRSWGDIPAVQVTDQSELLSLSGTRSRCP